MYTSALLSPLKRASNIAHELYGHAYFYEKGLNPLHDYKPISNEYPGEFTFIIAEHNEGLTKHIKIVESNAITNYSTKNK